MNCTQMNSIVWNANRWLSKAILLIRAWWKFDVNTMHCNDSRWSKGHEIWQELSGVNQIFLEWSGSIILAVISTYDFFIQYFYLLYDISTVRHPDCKSIQMAQSTLDVIRMIDKKSIMCAVDSLAASVYLRHFMHLNENYQIGNDRMKKLVIGNISTSEKESNHEIRIIMSGSSDRLRGISSILTFNIVR